MVSDKETANIRRFVCGQLRDEPDLSTLTLGILKKRYLAHVGCDSLSQDARNFMKEVVKEELMKMQDDDSSGSELETKKTQKKRKREKETDEEISEKEDESRTKKTRVNHSSSSSESEEKEEHKTGSEQSSDEEQSQSDDAEQEVEKSQPHTNGKGRRQINSDDSSGEEDTKSRTKGNESTCGDSPKEMEKTKENATKNGVKKNSNTSEGKKTPQSDKENDIDSDSKSERSDKISDNESSDDSEKEEKVSVGKKNDGTDSDSSSLPSLEDKRDSGTENARVGKEKKKKKTVKKDDDTKGQKDDNKAVVRLKRYISLCGVRRNYKKLLDGCRSVRSKVAVLKKELEDLGVDGQPSIKKCKKVRMQREEAQEVADLDVNNIITTQGRPKRRQASAWQQPDPPSSAYQRSLNSDSDSDQEQNGRRKVTEWANLRGIISDDADSD